MATTKFFPLLLLLAAAAACAATTKPCSSSSPSSDSTLTLLHIYGKCSPYPTPNSASWFDTVLDMATKDKDRVRYLAGLTAINDEKTKVPVASGQEVIQTGNYIVRTKFGTPGQLLFMVLDTSNDAAWIPCSGCHGCSATPFSANHSSTYRTIGCKSPKCSLMRSPTCSAGTGVCLFNQSYGGDSSFAGELSSDTLRLALDVIPGYGFGCVKAVSGTAFPPQGLLGLGRGPLSLLSQSGQLYKGVFSYCLPSFRSSSFSGSLKLGPTGQPRMMKTTPLLHNPHRPSLYYVNLTGISIRKHPVAVPAELLAFNTATGAGTIIDSGTVITRFVEPVYIAIRDEFRKRVKGNISSLGAFDTCFVTPQNLPLITLHFTGMDLTLPMENSVIHRSSGPIACLAMAAAPTNLNSVINVIANLQQQNLRVLFDVGNSRVGISRELCK